MRLGPCLAFVWILGVYGFVYMRFYIQTIAYRSGYQLYTGHANGGHDASGMGFKLTNTVASRMRGMRMGGTMVLGWGYLGAMR